jgi:uncharacterized repeat protein (TIGR03803 family)
MKKVYSLLLALISLGALDAQYVILNNFNGTGGENPYGDLVQSGNVLYGMAQNGGANGYGCIFSIKTNGTGFTDLLDFNGKRYPEGANPLGSLTISGNMLYGMTQYGGLKDSGCIFSIDTNGNGYQDLLDLNAYTGAEPRGSLTISGNILYGMTLYSGNYTGFGNVFSIHTDGTSFKILYQFYNGGLPNNNLLLSGKILYGTTSFGGIYNDGSVFSIDTNGYGYSDLLDFDGTNGKEPVGSLVISGNKLFGMTYEGGADNDGLIFSLDTSGGGFNDLLDFNITNGDNPTNGFTVGPGGLLYGMVLRAGLGKIFSIDTDGAGFNPLIQFNDQSYPAGAYPFGDLLRSGLTYYGMTDGGGTNNDGVIFSFTPCTFSLTASVTATISCYGQSNAAALATPGGGASPYTYSWSPGGGTNSSVSNLSAGTYSVTVIDSNGCTATASLTITSPNPVTITMSSQTNVSCNGGTNGTATANSASGGTPLRVINGVAGNHIPGFHGDGGPAISAELYWPSAAVVDPSGNIFIADTYNSTIREVNYSTGIITTVAGVGGSNGHGGDGGPATSAKLYNPSGVALDASGDIFIADQENGEIRLVNHSTGYISTVAGMYNGGNGGYSGDGGPATAAELDAPGDAVTDNSGNIYIADLGNNAIREVLHSNGYIYTIAGNGTGGYTGDGGPATAAEINAPSGVAVDSSGNIYIADSFNSVIREINHSTGKISTVAGNGTTGYKGDGGPATAAELFDPNGVAIDGAGNMFIADIYNNVIREVNYSSGIITTVTGDGYKAGTGYGGYSGNGGPANAAEMYNPSSVAVDAAGNLYSADTYNSQVRKTSSEYTYSWSPSGGTNLTASNLSAGTYTITATDANSCTGSAVVTIWQPNALNVSANVITNVSCNGYSNGSASSVISGGTSPFTYAWSAGGTISSVSSLSRGSFTVTVTDSCGSSATASVNITQPNQLNVSANTINNVSCNGGNNGSASSTVSGGTTPYTYVWSDANSQTTPSASGLSIGTYTLNVTDNNGCAGSATVSISQPNQLNVSANTTNNVSCYGGNSGSASSTVSGGTTPYTYVWSDANSQTTPSASGLSAGTYSVNVTDANGCTGSATVNIMQPGVVIVTPVVISNEPCHGESVGIVTASTSGGTGPYTYEWSPSYDPETGPYDYSGLSAGSYTVIVTDNNGCTGSAVAAVTQPTALTVITDSTNDNGNCNGSAWVTVSGGTSPYTYLWTGALTTDTISNHCAGNYCCTITDANGCIDSACVTINLFTGTNKFIAKSTELNVYPNPNNGVFSIQSSANLGRSSIEIYNILGQLVYSNILNLSKGSDVEINLNDKPAGIYFYRVISEDGNLLGEGKLVIEK